MKDKPITDDEMAAALMYAERVAMNRLRGPELVDKAHDAAVDGLLVALKVWTQDRGASFKTFLTLCVRRKCIDELRKHLGRSGKNKTRMEEYRHLHAPVSYDTTSEQAELKDDIAMAMRLMSPAVKAIMTAHASGMLKGIAIRRYYGYACGPYGDLERNEINRMRKARGYKIRTSLKVSV